MSLPVTSRFLDLRALAGLDTMRFVTRHRIDGPYSGRHRSRQRGGAGEFVDFREYVHGEDLRHLDWKVLARTGRSYVRLFQEETNLLCTLVVDASGSMRFNEQGGRAGRGSKLEYCQYLATALCHIILQQRDQVGLAVAASGLDTFIPPGGTHNHAVRVQTAIEELKTRPVTNLAEALHTLFTRLSRRGVLLVMSDFLVDDLDRLFASVRLFRHAHWEVVILHVIHPDEERLPEGLAYHFEGLEGEGHVDCSPDRIRRLYCERFDAYAAMVRSQALAAGCDYRRVSTAIPYLRTLSGFLVERAG